MAMPLRQDFAFSTAVKVRWGDMDSLGHVNNARFFTFDEQGRLEYFQAVGDIVPDFWTASGLILAKISCDFIAQVHYPADLEVCIRIVRLGRTSMETQGAIFQDQKLVAVTAGVVVWFDYVSQKSAPIPANVRDFICQREVLTPLGA